MLLEELRKLPEFVAFEEAVKNNLTKENVYVRSNMPEVGEYLDEDFDDEGNRFYDKRYKSKEQAEEEEEQGSERKTDGQSEVFGHH